ncbi:MAG: 7-cyano-7-deazaguanine synthase QueC [Salinisphaera sp.]|jgi:7-cyano-7-deazaguanine synthase|nr:7-cyano-7-deazaguanine synthase QueC [Salinisphaera sp.]
MRAPSHGSPAVILFSGGLDSTTCLAQARADGHRCHALSFDYGQRHTAELTAARHIAASAGVAEHKCVRIDFDGMGGSALTDARIDVPEAPSEGIPSTYVPARNTLFLSVALGWAEILEADAIYIGVNAVDYSGYPDCRPEFIAAFEKLARLATKAGAEDGHRFAIRTPLIDLSKADIIRKGTALGVDYSQTVSCYQADDRGRACGVCDACRLRRKGFEDAAIADPTRYWTGD